MTDAAKYCHSCGSSLAGQIPPASAPTSSVGQHGKKKEPGLSFPPSGDEYPDGDFGEASGIWNGLTVWQRRIWNAGGRPDLLTYAGRDFGEWIIDNADEAFNFDEFVEDWSSRSEAEVGRKSERLGPLAASSWVLGLGLLVGLLATLVSESNSSFLSFIGNFASATAGLGIFSLIVLAVVYAFAPATRAVLNWQMLGLLGWIGIALASAFFVFVVGFFS